MINTIFYFVPTFAEYQVYLNNGDIAARTIVFVADQRAIYKNGIRYGGYNSQELNDTIIDLINQHEYDDSEIRAWVARIEGSINTANGLINQLNDDIDDIINAKHAEIQAIIDGTFSEYGWLKKNLGDVFAYSGFQNELNGFLTTVGVLKDSDNRWTSLLQTVNSITGRVANIQDGLFTENQIKQWISDGVSGIDLSAYAYKSEVNDVADLLGLLQIKVNSLEDSVTTTLSSTVRQYLGNDLETGVANYLQNQAGLILDSNLDAAVANLFSRTTSNTKTAVDNLIDNKAGLITESNLDSAMATVFAQNASNAYAALQLGVKSDLTGDQSWINGVADKINLKGDQVTITADHGINLQGTTWASIIDAQNLIANNLTAGAITSLGDITIKDTNNKTIAQIDKDGRAKFIDGHIYIPYLTRNWWTGQETPTVALYIDSVPEISKTTTYANSVYGGAFYPRTRFEPHGFCIEDGNKAVMGALWADPSFETVGGQNQMTSYEIHMNAYDTQDVNRHAGIACAPSLVREGHESSGGYCKICNYAGQAAYTTHSEAPANYDYTAWKGLMEINQWHSISFEAGDALGLRTHTTSGRGLVIESKIDIDAKGTFNSNLAMSVSSDERIKTIKNNLEPEIEDIAKARIVDFTYNNDESNTVHAGSIAQDWQNVIPNAVNENEDGMLSLDYGAIATVSAVTAAKEIVKLKQENEQLKARLAAIEAALNL